MMALICSDQSEKSIKLLKCATGDAILSTHLHQKFAFSYEASASRILELIWAALAIRSFGLFNFDLFFRQAKGYFQGLFHYCRFVSLCYGVHYVSAFDSADTS